MSHKEQQTSITMNADDIHAWIKAGRDERFEWLAESAPVKAIAQILAAMGNSAGGYVLIGASGPTGTVFGVRDGHAAVERVMKAAGAISPPMGLPWPEVVTVHNKPVVVVHVPEGLPGVYAYEGRFMRRNGGENVPLNPSEVYRLGYERGARDFETEIVADATLDDIDWVKARAYANAIRPSEVDIAKVLQRRGCLALAGGVLRPTHAGILLFGAEPTAFVRGAEIIAARFPGEDMSDRFTRTGTGITGTLPDQIRRAEAFLLDHLHKDVQIGKAMAHTENLEYPFEAARELIINAVAHRDYSIAGDAIRLFIFSNRLEVTSPGRLAGPVTLANIREARFSRNPVIVGVLADMHYIERLGYGVDRVMALMEEKGLPAPEFSEIAGTFRVRLRRGASHGAGETPKPPQEQVIDKTFRGLPLNPRQEVAIQHLTRDTNQRITNSHLQQMFPDVHAETIRRDLSDLVSKNILEKRGEKRGSFYVLKLN